jgi:hypothetical protein
MNRYSAYVKINDSTIPVSWDGLKNELQESIRLQSNGAFLYGRQIGSTRIEQSMRELHQRWYELSALSNPIMLAMEDIK